MQIYILKRGGGNLLNLLPEGKILNKNLELNLELIINKRLFLQPKPSPRKRIFEKDIFLSINKGFRNPKNENLTMEE